MEADTLSIYKPLDCNWNGEKGLVSLDPCSSKVRFLSTKGDVEEIVALLPYSSSVFQGVKE